jgi:hypothetical protein
VVKQTGMVATKITDASQVLVAHFYNPDYLGDLDGVEHGLRPAQAYSL